ncbi:MAG: hypothetical protein IJJ45_02505 [Clostridia bacterium]|nr:hypothetical protein [Clostridia bacterium]
MKITTFVPQIIPKDMETVVQLFQELGFAKHQAPTGCGEPNAEDIRMKDANGFCLDISSMPNIRLPHDVVVIRMTVDDFDEAYQLLQKYGFRDFNGDRTAQTAETASPRSALMILPSGFAINLIQHITK